MSAGAAILRAGLAAARSLPAAPPVIGSRGLTPIGVSLGNLHDDRAVLLGRDRACGARCFPG